MSYLAIQPDTTGSLYYDQEVQLEGTIYIFSYLWAPRETCWYLNILDQDENQIATGIKLVVTWPLLLKYAAQATIPPGRLILIDMTGNNQDIQVPGDLGTRCLLLYITSDDPDVAQIDALTS